jgi:hypothetical protein
MNEPQRKHSQRKYPFRPPAQPLQDFGADIIRRLQERGEWDNVEGKGKPLKIEGDLSDLPTMSAKLRKDANFSTPWSDLKTEIEKGEKSARDFIFQRCNRGGVAARAERTRRQNCGHQFADSQIQPHHSAANAAVAQGASAPRARSRRAGDFT